MTSAHTSGYAAVPSGRLYYETAGDGQPLVLIHAGVADAGMWDEQVEDFARRYRVIRYDVRGFGRSESEPVAFSERDDLLALLDRLGVERAIVLGLSRGGTLAVDFTLEHPERVAAVIAAAAGLSGYQHPPEQARPVETEAFTAMDEAYERGDDARLVELELQVWVDGPGQPAGRAPQAVRERVQAMEERNVALSRRGAEPQPQPLAPPAVGRLAEIRVPALVVYGDLDTTAILAIAERLATGIPGARRVVFEGAAHMLNMEQPERFNRTVLEFLEGAGF
jgi:3-oxoadipate enol-lactonase